jgi:hypothetical protein
MVEEPIIQQTNTASSKPITFPTFVTVFSNKENEFKLLSRTVPESDTLTSPAASSSIQKMIHKKILLPLKLLISI